MRLTRRGALAGAVVAVTMAVSLAACGTGTTGSATAGSSSGTAQLSIVASTDVYGDIARQVAGDAATITSVISDPSQDPHSYEADTRTQLALSKASVIIENGGGYDDFMQTMTTTAGNTSASVIDVVDLSGKTAPAGGDLNEHVWYDVPTVGKLSNKLVQVLSQKDPRQASTFAANAAAFDAKLAVLEADEAKIKAAHAGAPVSITEPVPLYLLQACGLVNQTPAQFSEAVEEGTDVPARVLQQTLALYSSKQVRLLAYNEQTAGAETQKMLDAARANGIPVVPVTETLPAGKDYIGWMTANLAAVSAALS